MLVPAVIAWRPVLGGTSRIPWSTWLAVRRTLRRTVGTILLLCGIARWNEGSLVAGSVSLAASLLVVSRWSYIGGWSR